MIHPDIVMLTELDISHGEYIYDQAKLRIKCTGTSGLSPDVQSFLSSLVHMYLATADYLWAIDLERMKSTLKHCFRSILISDRQVRADSAITHAWDVIFDKSTTDLGMDANAPAAIIERIASTMPGFANGFALLLQGCFFMIMTVYEGLQVPLRQSSDLEMRVALEDVKDAGLRFGLLIFEVHKRACEIKLREERDAINEVVLRMEHTLLTNIEERQQAEDVGAKWCEGLHIAAKEFLQVQARVDEVFEEMILV